MFPFTVKKSNAQHPSRTAQGIVADLAGASSIGVTSYFNIVNNWIAPQPFADVIREIETLDPDLYRKIATRPDVSAILSTPVLARFRQQVISRGATLYSAGMQWKRKRLLVVFCGQAHRPGMPLPVFLQHTPWQEFDVLYFQDKNFNHFRSGTSGGAHDFGEVIAIYNKVRSAKRYRDTIVLGVSAGGLSAMRFALQTRPARAISIGAQPVNDTLRILNRQATKFSAFDPVCACLPRQPRPFYFAHCKTDPLFERFAVNAAKLTGGQSIAVHAKVNHAVMAPLWEMGRLDQFYPKIIHPDFPNNITTDPNWQTESDGKLAFH